MKQQRQKKLVLAITLMLLIILLPMAALAVSADKSEKPKLNVAEFEQIVSEMLTFPRDEPVDGQTISLQELNAILAPYRSKMSINGNTFYTKTMDGDFIKKNNKWELGRDVNVSWLWANSTSRNMYNEMLTVARQSEPSYVRVIDVRLNKEDDKFIYMYTWIKWDKTGQLVKIPKRETQHKPGETENRDRASASASKSGNAILYKDQTVAGQICKVYRIEKTYYWLSTLKGFDIMTANYGAKGKDVTQKIHFTYDMLGVNKNSSFFEPPSDVKFSEQGNSGDSSGKSSDKAEAKPKKPSFGDIIRGRTPF